MKCLHPSIFNISAYGREYKAVPVPCGKCEACLYNKSLDWQNRIRVEHKHSSNAFFFTLTYADEYLKYHTYVDESTGAVYETPCVSRKDVSNFMKRLRKNIGVSGIRFFLVSEYAPLNLRPHYHGILFNLPSSNASFVRQMVEKSWGQGFVTTSKLTDGRIGYSVKYCFGNMDLPYYYKKPFVQCSKRPALGWQWMETLEKQMETLDLNKCHFHYNGFNFPVPRYYRDKVKRGMSEHERKDAFEDYLSVMPWCIPMTPEEVERNNYEILHGLSHTPTEYEMKVEKFLRNFNKSKKKRNLNKREEF